MEDGSGGVGLGLGATAKPPRTALPSHTAVLVVGSQPASQLVSQPASPASEPASLAETCRLAKPCRLAQPCLLTQFCRFAESCRLAEPCSLAGPCLRKYNISAQAPCGCGHPRAKVWSDQKPQGEASTMRGSIRKYHVSAQASRGFGHPQAKVRSDQPTQGVKVRHT